MHISKQDKAFMKLAYEAALKSQCRWRVGAALVRNGSVLAVSPNVKRHHPRDVQTYTVHSECVCLNIAKSPKGANIYVVRIGRAGDLRMARPCSCCIRSLFNAGVNKATWSDTRGLFSSAKIVQMMEVLR